MKVKNSSNVRSNVWLQSPSRKCEINQGQKGTLRKLAELHTFYFCDERHAATLLMQMKTLCVGVPSLIFANVELIPFSGLAFECCCNEPLAGRMNERNNTAVDRCATPIRYHSLARLNIFEWNVLCWSCKN